VAKLFAPNVMVGFLNRLVVSIEEILSTLNDDRALVEADELDRRLHNLAGTAGTLGFGVLSAAARELQADRSGSYQGQQRFIETARATLRNIASYTSDMSNPVPALGGSPRLLNILIADDVAMIREIASAYLQSAGHTVTCVEGGAEAIAAAATADFHLVLMDVRMPGIDGLEAARQIRAFDGTRGCVPIVAMTALTSPGQIAECRNAGMDSHLFKPFDSHMLLAAIRCATQAVPAAHQRLVTEL
jgi:CheY-like chemotaxis protein